MYLPQNVIFFFFALGTFVLQAFHFFLATLFMSYIDLSQEILACHDPGIYFVQRLTVPSSSECFSSFS